MRFILILLIAMAATITWQSIAVANASASVLPDWLFAEAEGKNDEDNNTDEKKTDAGEQEPECE